MLTKEIWTEHAGKTVFTNKNLNQSLNVHLLEYNGWSTPCVYIILATLYISLSDHPICIFIHELWWIVVSFITMCVKYESHIGLILFTWWHFKDCSFCTILCIIRLYGLFPTAPAPPFTHLTFWVISLIIRIMLIWKFLYLKENKITYKMTLNLIQYAVGNKLLG